LECLFLGHVGCNVPDPGFIPDPRFFHPGSASKNLSILTQKKWFLKSRKYDPGCSSGS
jgi:hypothetical protein